MVRRLFKGIGYLSTGGLLLTAVPAFAQNLVLNGDFELGDVGFSSAYTDVTFLPPSGSPFTNPITLPATYEVDTNPRNPPNPIGHYAWASFGDHTTGSGNMMIINGANKPNVVVWQQTITGLIPGTTYYFGAYGASLFSGNPAQLNFQLNGNKATSIFNYPNATGQWVGYYTSFVLPASSSSETFAIVNQNTSFQGNDFALDDIYVGTTPMTGDPPPNFLPNISPEPTTLALLLLPLPVVARFRRKRRDILTAVN